jgi:hypothetical protein
MPGRRGRNSPAIPPNVDERISYRDCALTFQTNFSIFVIQFFAIGLHAFRGSST